MVTKSEICSVDMVPEEWKEAYLAIHDELARAKKEIDFLREEYQQEKEALAELQEKYDKLYLEHNTNLYG